MRRHICVLAAIGVMSVGARPAEAADAQAGQGTFESFCAACHSVARPAQTLQGPSLAGIVGRRAAALPGFSYSAAMKASGVVWTPANLDTYLANPKARVPGTLMTFRGVSDPIARANLVAYLAQQK